MRGQALRAIVIFVVVSVVLGALGVDNALGLGLLSGAMEFLPVIGPLAGAGAAILVAFFQSSPGLGLTPLQFAIAVAVAMIVIQQIENTLLVPRIVGRALNLHPLLVMVSVIMGASIAGLLGAILAAPIVASIRILGEYAWHKMLDLPPFPDDQDEPPANSEATEIVQNRQEKPAEPAVYPLSFQPVFKDYIWGGRNLETILGRELPAGNIAESWEIAAHPNGQTKVKNGPLAGCTLDQVRQRWGERLLGSSVNSTSFPLLIKLLDANRWLSVQVHPDDAYAMKNAGELGKTELWIILHAEPGAEIIYGLKSGVDRQALSQATEDGAAESQLHRLPIQTGDAVYVPAGTVHALGPGALVAEIQQNSDTTYRLYDWDRTDAEGQARPLHVRQALDVVDWRMVEPTVAPPPTLPAPNGWTREALADLRAIGGPASANLRSAAKGDTSCPYFRVDRLVGQANSVWRDQCGGNAFQIWGVLNGRATLHSDGPPVDLRGISWLLLPAALGAFEFRLQADSTLLKIH